MIGRMFYYLLNMSIIASLMIMILLLLRTVFYRVIPKTVFYYMWGIVLVRLIIPVSFPCEFSILNLIRGKFIKTVMIPKAFDDMLNLSVINSIQGANEYFPLHYKTNSLVNLFEKFGIVWIVGFIIFTAAFIVIYKMTSIELDKAVLLRNNRLLEILKKKHDTKPKAQLFETDFVSSPIVFGIIKPRIIIPKDISDEILVYALPHELVHIKRYDNLWKLISVFAVCFHWFNPFVWLFLYILGKDMELSCDEKVIKEITADERKQYANALAAMAIEKKIVFTGFGGSTIKSRLINIVTYKPVPLIMSLITGIICLAVTYMLVTNPLL